MGLFGIKTKADKEREARNQVRHEIRQLEQSHDYNTPYFSCESYIRADYDALDALTAYLKDNKLLTPNEDFQLSKQELADHYGETKVYNYLPYELDYKLDGEKVYIRYGDADYIYIGTLPPDKAPEIISLLDKDYSDIKLYFVGTQYKELSTEDFEHYKMDKDDQTAICITYRKQNPAYLVKLARIKELERKLSSMP